MLPRRLTEGVMEVKLAYERETEDIVVYGACDRDATCVESLYIKKDSMEDITPEITLTITMDSPYDD